MQEPTSIPLKKKSYKRARGGSKFNLYKLLTKRKFLIQELIEVSDRLEEFEPSLRRPQRGYFEKEIKTQNNVLAQRFDSQLKPHFGVQLDQQSSAETLRLEDLSIE